MSARKAISSSSSGDGQYGTCSALWCMTCASTTNAAPLSSGRGSGNGRGELAAWNDRASAISPLRRAANTGETRVRTEEETRR